MIIVIDGVGQMNANRSDVSYCESRTTGKLALNILSCLGEASDHTLLNGSYRDIVKDSPWSEYKTGFSRSFTIETALQPSLWMLTTGIALAFILKGKVQQHRQWMTRSFGTGPLISLEARVIFGLLGTQSPAAIETVVWVCTASSIFVADVVLQVQELLRNRPLSAKARAS